MAVTVLTTTMAGAVNYSVTTASSSDWASVSDINNDWFLFLSESDKNEIGLTQYAYLLSLNEFEYVPPIIENPFI